MILAKQIGDSKFASQCQVHKSSLVFHIIVRLLLVPCLRFKFDWPHIP